MKLSSILSNKLSENLLTVGSWLTIPHQSVVEILASAGFEWLVIDLEHASIDISQAMNLIGHIQGNNMQALVRVSKNEEVIIKRVLDAGADGIIVPMVKNKLEAQEAVSYVKYPPIGKRGVGLSRAQNYGISFPEYKEWVQKDVVVIAQVEHFEAVNNLEDILNTNGIDGVIVGPYDLSASMGCPGEYQREDVKAALDRILEVTMKSEKSLGFHVIESDYSKLKERIAQGYTFLAFSLDFFFLGDSAREEMKKFKEDI